VTTALPVSGARDEAAWSAVRAAFPRAAEASIATLTSTATRFSFEPRASRPPGSRTPTIYLILSGQVAVSQATADGRVSVLGLYGPGTLVGLTTFAGGPDLLGLEAVTATSGVAWPSDHIREVAEQDCAMLQDVLEQFVHRVRLTLGLLEQQTFATARARLAAFMARHEQLVFSPGTPAIGRAQLSAMVGVSREMTSRILRGWERAEIVGRVGRSGLILVDRRRLEAEAEAAPDRAAIDEARALIS
jgi:CRP-like cAMP-binding protein